MPRPRLVVRPPGTRTREEVAAELPDVPLTTLRNHLKAAAIGEWVPPGTNRVVVLYDASRIVELVKRLPPGRARPRRRRRRRNADPAIEYDIPAGWITLGDLARSVGCDTARLQRTLDAHSRRATARAAKLGEEEAAALAALFDALGRGGDMPRPIPAAKRIVTGRQRWTYDETLARAALASAACPEPSDEDPWHAFSAAAAKCWAPDGANEREQARLAEQAGDRIRGSARRLGAHARAATIVGSALEAFAAVWRGCATTVARRRAFEEISRLGAWTTGERSAHARAIATQVRQAPNDLDAVARIEALFVALVGAPFVNSAMWQRALSSLGSRCLVAHLEELLSAVGEDREAALRALRLKVLKQALRPIATSWAASLSAADTKRFVAAFVAALWSAVLRGKSLDDVAVEALARKIAPG